jgi:hypothetical protein
MATIRSIFEQIGKEPDQGHERRKELLESLQTTLANIPRAETAAAVGDLSLETLFDCLGSEYE